MADQQTPIDEYIQNQPESVRVILINIRDRVKKIIPEATETMSYGMPTFDLNGHHLVYFSAWKNHIGLYPLYEHGKELQELFAPYNKVQNSVHLPYNANPFPYDLIEKFVQHRVIEEAKK